MTNDSGRLRSAGLRPEPEEVSAIRAAVAIASCPFCGRDGLSRVDNYEWEIARVECSNNACRTSGPYVNLHDFCTYEDAEAAAVAAWNARIPINEEATS